MSNPERAFVFVATQSAKNFLLGEGTDLRYGARHLKRSIERCLVQPLSNLIATDQIRGGDYVRVDCLEDSPALIFSKEAEGLPINAMAELVDHQVPHTLSALANAVGYESSRTVSARTSRRS
jgi:hypothetical protein